MNFHLFILIILIYSLDLNKLKNQPMNQEDICRLMTSKSKTDDSNNNKFWIIFSHSCCCASGSSSERRQRPRPSGSFTKLEPRKVQTSGSNSWFTPDRFHCTCCQHCKVWPHGGAARLGMSSVRDINNESVLTCDRWTLYLIITGIQLLI